MKETKLSFEDHCRTLLNAIQQFFYIGCPTRYRTRYFFNNFTTNEDIASKFKAVLPHCVRNVKEKNVLLFKFRCNIFIGVRIIKEMPGSVASGTLCIIIWRSHYDFELLSPLKDIPIYIRNIGLIRLVEWHSLTGHKRSHFSDMLCNYTLTPFLLIQFTSITTHIHITVMWFVSCYPKFPNSCCFPLILTFTHWYAFLQEETN
jgi:hypothetical protein